VLVVTGPGRSGTSLVAELYRELGFEPGGRWNPKVRAGNEDSEIVDVNRRIAKALGMGRYEDRRRRRRSVTKKLRRAVRRRRLRAPRLDAPLDWSRFSSTVERFGPTLRHLADSHAVVKDPRFAWTLRVWAAAGANIEHVLVCIRSLDAMVASRIAAGMTGHASEQVVRNAIVYHVGLCMTALHDYGLEYNVVRFPDFAKQPETLYAAMQFPESVSRERFLEAFARVAREDLIH
jgi:hypothetical protein